MWRRDRECNGMTMRCTQANFYEAEVSKLMDQIDHMVKEEEQEYRTVYSLVFSTGIQYSIGVWGV